MRYSNDRKKMRTISYSEPFINFEEKRELLGAIAKRRISGDGPICRQVETKLREMLKARNVFLVTSGTHALELALMALRLKKGDEVICPSFTFVSTANAIIRQGARPVFAEIEMSTLNMDIDDAARRITKRTKAIIPVHYAGFSCDMERLVKTASRKNIRIIEDAAQAIDARYNGKSLGTFGDMGCFSFHSTKNVTCGEGGAIVVNKKVFEKDIQVMREKGTNRSLFLKGKIARYTWIDVGSSFVISDILAALLLAQLRKTPLINKRRRAIFKMYKDRLMCLEKNGIISLPDPDPRSLGNGHIFWILLKSGISRRAFIDKLRKLGIECTHHYVPLHNSPFGIRELGCRNGDLPITEDVSERLVRLPLHCRLTARDVDFVTDSVKKILAGE